ncbi:MAG: F0F1 ATP synthase subunit alpha, partial [Elusimicrobia bacterium]|nr:F0F1 ATP synthase subunit alpha [Elusimicrobiota bacterium]
QTKAMKQVAGRLRLDMAQFNELAAFAQFGSELDKASQQQLARGERMQELLKQDQFRPLPFESQVAIIFAGINGFLDDVPARSIRQFEREFLRFLQDKRKDVLPEIVVKKNFDDALKEKLTAALKEFKPGFKPEQA